jgi:protein O-mannosyl-transferase
MSRAKRTPAGPWRVERIWLRAAGIALAGILTYSNSLSAPFIFDDHATVVQNATIRDLSRWNVVFSPPEHTPVAGRPIVNLSFAINHALAGLDVTGYHAFNILIHLACALLVFGLVRRTLRLPHPRAGASVPLTEHATDMAFAVAVIWIVHPVNSEAVNYITQRTESLMALCYLLTLYASVRAWTSGHTARWSGIAVASCLAGMACKETMVTAPIVVVLYDSVFLFGSLPLALRSRGTFYAALASTWVLLAALVASHGQTLSSGFGTARVSPWTYLLNQAVMVVRYLRLSIWPDSLVVYYGWPQPLTIADVWPYGVVVIALLVITVVTLVRAPRLGFLGAWVFITLAPTSSVLSIATEVGAERRMYLPLVGVIALMVVAATSATCRAGVSAPAERRGLKATPCSASAAALLLLIAVSLSARTIARNREYRSALTMAETVLERWPSASAENLVGTELAVAGQHAEAIPHLREAARGYPAARYVLGSELLVTGQLDAGIEELRTFVREEPDLLATRAAHGLLANALASRRDYAGAIPHYREYLAAHATDANAWTGLGIALIETGKPGEALAAFRGAVNSEPGNPRFKVNLARALLDHGDLDDAARVAQETMALSPADPAPHDVLGRVLAARGQVDAARREFSRALQLDPAYVPARDALLTLGR